MGAVYRAKDEADGSIVAVKILRADRANRPTALRRFHKEARLLAEVNNPYVTNLLEVNADRGVHYLVLEFVPGRSVATLAAERTRLEEPLAVSIMADVARALVDAHERGIVHRDIKPDNILLLGSGEPPRVKLSDFGLARHIIETESLQVTQAGTVLGTPLYMSPEQCTGREVDARTDIYAMGATLFHLLAGEPPFMAETTMAVIALHCQSPVPSLQKLNPAVSDAVCRIVEKCLAKSPTDRYANAGELLQDLERHLRGEPSGIAIHPQLPPSDPQNLLQYDWSWELEASPEQLRLLVSNTERFNRAVGLTSVEFTAKPDAGNRMHRFGRFRKMGLTAAWEEHPFEWIEGRRMGVLREYSQGPFKWLVSVVELRRGFRRHPTYASCPRRTEGFLGRTAAAVEVGIRGRRSVDRVYRRIDAALTGKLGRHAPVDPFEEPAILTAARRKRLDKLLDKLSERGLDPGVLERLGEFLAEAPAKRCADSTAGPGKTPWTGRESGRSGVSDRRRGGIAGAPLGHPLPHLPHSLRGKGDFAAATGARPL